MTRITMGAVAFFVAATALGCDRGTLVSPDIRGTGPSRPAEGTGTPGSAVPGGNGDARDGETRSVAIRDTRSDRSTTGRAPDFVEIDTAAIEGDVDSLTLSMTLAGKIPVLMPDEVTTMRVTFVVVTKGGDRYEFFAHATRNGWAPFASGRPDAEPPFAEDLAISDRTIAMTVDRSYLGPPAPFKWTANVAWTRRAERGEAFAFDLVPKKGYADFP